MSSAKKKNESVEWQRLAQLFDRVLACAPEDRALFLKEATQGNPALRAELQALVDAHEQSADFLERPVLGSWRSLLSQSKLPEAPQLELGTTIGDFRIVSLLGRGTFATVYLARQLSLERDVALKVSSDYDQEARTMAQLDHPNIVQVYSQSADRERALCLVCMQYVAGPTLEQVLERHIHDGVGPLDGPRYLDIVDSLGSGAVLLSQSAFQERARLIGFDAVDLVLWLGARLAEAAAHAHERKILHLDIKPSNILITTGGRPLLTDFNVAIRSTQLNENTSVQLGGTFDYMAPEQRDAFFSSAPENEFRLLDGRADVYSLGRVLRDLDAAAQGVLGRLLERATVEDIERRYPSADEMARAFQIALENRHVEKAMPSAGPITRLAMRYPIGVLTGLGALPQLVGTAIATSYNRLQIVDHLTPLQQNAFQFLLTHYLSLFYVLGGTLWAVLMWQLQRDLARDGQNNRRRMLRLPIWVCLVAILSWMPGAFLFPYYINVTAGPVSVGIFKHFLISFSLSCAVCLAYSFSFAQFLCLRVLYERFCTDKCAIRSVAAMEIGSLYRAQIVHFLMSAVPLAGAALLVWVGPENAEPHRYRLFLTLVDCLIFLGLAGAYLALRVSGQMEKIRFALIG